MIGQLVLYDLLWGQAVFGHPDRDGQLSSPIVFLKTR